MKELQGIAAAPGLSIGEAIWWKNEELVISEQKVDNPEQEKARLQEAIEQAKTDIRQLREQTAEKMGESEAAIFDAHLAFLDDPAYTGEMKQRLETQKRNAEVICQEVTQEMKQMLSALDDEYMQARADDVADVGQRLLRLLTGKTAFDPSQLRPGHIVIADELTPSQTAQFPPGIAGMITATGSQTAHAAIMARTLGIPAVLGLGEQLKEIGNGEQLILDGSKGVCILDASEALLQETQQQIDLAKKQHEIALQEAVHDAHTADGKRIQVFANIGSPQDVESALANHAEGVGLFRTEFLYLENDHWPTEEEQFQAYRKVLSAFGDKPVIIRTLDIGGDKELPYADLPQEENPFLGHRAVRFCLDHPDIFRTQLTALLRASHYGNLWIMLPMIENAAEIRAVKKLLEECKQDLDRRKEPYASSIPLGIMIEIPAAAIMADQLAAEVDFMSIGTNDLTQYTLAADRGNEKVAHLYDALHPAVLRLIKMTCDAGKKHNIVVGMCGELAGDTEATEMLVELGLDELSMSAASIPRVKQNIRAVDTQKPTNQLDRILAAEDGAAVRRIIQRS